MIQPQEYVSHFSDDHVRFNPALLPLKVRAGTKLNPVSMHADFFRRLNAERKLAAIDRQSHHAEGGRDIDHVDFRTRS
jgi:hypothetical protein